MSSRLLKLSFLTLARSGRLCLSRSMMAGPCQTRALLRTADAVTFDVDSTVCIDEGIDELADFCGVGEKVKQLTNQAMGGSVSFKEALQVRLDAINPSINQISHFISKHPPMLTEGIAEVVHRLQERGTDVYFISGGFDCIIEPVAKQLKVPTSHIYANRIKFFHDGNYAGFDETAATSDSGGKGKVIQMLKDKYGYQSLIHVGDGATDLEACPPADGFIGFGGNVIREKVKKEAKWFVMSFQEIIDELEKSRMVEHSA